jgi:mycothiol system anti-sigma-R factor
VICSSVRDSLEAYSDGELDASQQSYIREHLEGCSSCRAAYEKLQRLQASIRMQAPYFRAPESLAQRVMTSVHKSEKTRYVAQGWGWKSIAVAASVALLLSLGSTLLLTRATPTANQLLTREILSEHARSMLGGHLIDVVSSDRHTVKPWFGNKVDFSPDVKDLTSQGYPLAGGRVDYLDGRPVAALVFHRAKHVINLFTWPSPQSRAEVISQNGYNVVSWTREGMTYSAVSDLNLNELTQFARLYQR